MSPPRSRIRPLAILHLAAAACFAFFIPPALRAADPAWWNDSAGGTKIWSSTPQSTGNWAPVNVGQLKNVAAKAKIYLDARLAGMGGAGGAVNSLVGGFTPVSPENGAPVNVGQLKNVAAVFYDRFAEVGFDWQSGAFGRSPRKYPWEGTVSGENGGPANIGQLKNLFSFVMDDTFKALMADSDGDGIPDFWMRHYGLKSANDLFAEMEGGTPVNSFGNFIAGYVDWVGTFIVFPPDQHVTNYGGSGVNGYAHPNPLPFVVLNTTASPVNVGAQQNLGSRQFWMHPGTWPGMKAVLRFTAPSDGKYRLSCVFQSLNPTLANTNGVDVGVTKAGVLIFSATIGQGSAPSASWTTGVDLLAGQQMDFTVDPRGWDYNGDSTGLYASVTREAADGDADGDGLSDLEEYREGTDPGVSDTDGDGISDRTEALADLNPQDGSDATWDADGDGVPDGVEAILQKEAPQLNPPASWAWLIPQLFQLNPHSSQDTDADGVPDDYETVFGLPTGIPVAVHNAGDAMAWRENSTPSNPFSCFKAGSGSGAGFTAFTQHTGTNGFYNGGGEIQGYTAAGSFPAVTVNRSASTSPFAYASVRPAGHQLLLHPADSGPEATLRFTAPVAGAYSFCARFESLSPDSGDGMQILVRKGPASELLFSQKIGHGYQRSITAGKFCILAAGETLDFSVGSNGARSNDSTGLTVTCYQLQTSPAADAKVTYDGNTLFAAAENSTPSNPFGCFKAGSGTGSGFTAFTQHTGTNGFYNGGGEIQGYTAASSFPAVTVNRSASPSTFAYASVPPAGHQLLLHPDDTGPEATLRFTAPMAGNYSYSARFDSLNPGGNGMEVSVRKGTGATALSSQKIGQGYPSTTAAFDGVCALAAGETLDFSVGSNGSRSSDSTGLIVSCSLLPGSPPSPADVVYDGNALFASAETRGSLNEFTPFEAGYTTAGTGYTAFIPSQHIPSGGSQGYWGFATNPSAWGTPAVMINPAPTDIINNPLFVPLVASHQMVLHPDNTGGKAIVRFTAPVPGNYSYSSIFQKLVPTGVSGSVYHDVEASVLRGTSQTLKTAVVGGTGYENSANLSGTCQLTAGETLDFAVGPHGDHSYDATGLTLTVTRLADGPLTDTDGDGLPDRVEAQASTWASVPAAWRYPSPAAPVCYSTTDDNLNGIPDIFEPALGFAVAGYAEGYDTAPPSFTRPDSRDTDSDGAWDGQEVVSGSDPRNPEDIQFPVGGGSAGAAVDPAWFQTGYLAGSNGAFRWKRLARPSVNPLLPLWDPSGDADGNPLPSTGDPQTTSPRLLMSNLTVPYSASWDPWVDGRPPIPPSITYNLDDWSPWVDVSESWPFSIFPFFERNIMWRGEGSAVPSFNLDNPGSEWFEGYKTKLIGGNVRGRVTVESITEYQDIKGAAWGGSYYATAARAPGSTQKVKTRYKASKRMEHAFQPDKMHKPDKQEGVFSQSLISDISSYNYAYSEPNNGYYLNDWWAGSSSETQEFYFGTGNLGTQARDNALGISCYGSVDLYWGLRGTLLRDFTAGGPLLNEFGYSLLKIIVLHFPPELKVFAGGTENELESGKPYQVVDEQGYLNEAEFPEGEYITVLPRNANADGEYSIRIDGVPLGAGTTRLIEGSSPSNFTADDSIVQGPSVTLVIKADASTEPGKAYSLNLSEDGGARFRKISIEGLPLADGKPQTEAESDGRADDTYVDALNLTLSHHTSDLHVPIANSDLALSADRTLRQNVYLDQDGQRPPSASARTLEDDTDEDGFVGQPFGACWSSSLTPHIILELDADATTPTIATVVDETGSQMRFAYAGKQPVSTSPATAPSDTYGFIPLPSPSDATSLLNRLEVVNTTTRSLTLLDLKKRFGTVTHYELAGYNAVAQSTRLRYYYRIRNNNTVGTKGVEDRNGNALYYTYPTFPAISLAAATKPARIASMLIPSQIADQSSAGRRLVISTATPTSFLGGTPGLPGRFIGSIALKEGTSDTPLQQTDYKYLAKAMSAFGPAPETATDSFNAPTLVWLAEVRRQTGTTPAYIPQSFDYAISYDPQIVNRDPLNSNHCYAHFWLSRITEGSGADARYHRFETTFDRTRMAYHSRPSSPNIRQMSYDQGLDRPVTAVFFGYGGKEQLLSEFKQQEGPNGPQPGFKIFNTFASGTSAPADVPPVSGGRVNAVVDADRRVRYYRFSQPAVRDTKAFQTLLFPQGESDLRERSVLIAWTRMEIDHTGGAKEAYTFNPMAMMALSSAEMTLPGSGGTSTTTRTDWEYKSPFKASEVCSYLAGKTYTGYNDAHVSGTWSIDLHPFFAKWYPDPTSEIRTLSAPADIPSYSVPPANGFSQVVKIYKYWADTQIPPDNTRPWSRTMVESTIGHRASYSTSISDSTRTFTKTTLQVTSPPSPGDTGLPLAEQVYGPGTAASGTPDRTTNMSYGTPPGSAVTGAPTFLCKTEVLNGVGTANDGTTQSLITYYYPDKYQQVSKTVTGDGATPSAATSTVPPVSSSTWHYTERNALGQTLADYSGKPDTEPTTASPLSSNTGATRYTYRMDGRLARVDYPRIPGNTTAFPDNSADSNSSKIYDYDATGRKIAERITDGAPAGSEVVLSKTVLDYDARGRVWRSWTDLAPYGSTPAAGDPVTSSTFSATGLVLTTTASSGLVTAYQYDWLRRPVSVVSTDSLGKTSTTAFSYDGAWCGDSLFSSSSFKPTATVGPALHSDGTPATTITVYDSLFRKVRESREYLPGTSAVTTWGYDFMGRVRTMRDPKDKQTSTTYDKLGNPATVDRPDGSSTVTQWTPAGLAWEVSEVLPAVGTVAAAQTRVTRTLYDAAGRSAFVYLPHPDTSGQIEDATKYNQWFQYDTAGRQTITTTRQSPASASTTVLLTARTFYDARGRMAKTTSDQVDDYGNPSFTANTSVPATEYRYDALDRKTWARASRGATPLPANWPASAAVSLTVYDGAGRVVREVSPALGFTSHSGTAASIATSFGRTMTRTAYDAAGRPVAVQTGVALPSKLTDTDAWDAATQQAYTFGATPAAGETLNSYNQRGQLLSSSRTASTGTVITESFQYDAQGNRTRVTDGSNAATAFTYDAFNRVLTTAHNAGVTGRTDTVTNAYNATVLTGTTDGNGRSTSFVYDNAYRLRTVTPAGGGLQDPVETHYYNSAGERVGVLYSGASWRDASWVYDGRGRIKSEISSGLTHTYEYDAAGNRTKVTYATGPSSTRVLTSEYDVLNRLIRCVENSRETRYYYDLTGGIRRRQLPNQNREDKTYDLAGRVTSQITSTSTGTLIAQTDSLYDHFGSLLTQTESRPAVTAGSLAAVNRTVLNTYDGVFRLTVESITDTAGTTATAWTYDNAGNRKSQAKSTNGSPTSSEAYDYTSASFAAGDLPSGFSSAAVADELTSYRPNQLRKITRTGEAGGAVFFRYDGNGSRVRQWDTAISATPQTSYTWDRYSRLIKVARGTQSWEYGYDARSRRLVRYAPPETGSGANTLEMESFSGGTSASRWSATGTITAPVRNQLIVETIRGSDFGGGVGGALYTLDGPASSSSGTLRFYEYGARGDVTGFSGTTGTPTFRAVYKAFGDHTTSGDPGPNRQRASTKDEESALGLLNEGYRWRDLQTGTFLSRDPAGFVDGPNLYAYVLQNPWSKFDPQGLSSYDVDDNWGYFKSLFYDGSTGFAKGAAVGAAASAAVAVVVLAPEVVPLLAESAPALSAAVQVTVANVMTHPLKMAAAEGLVAAGLSYANGDSLEDATVTGALHAAPGLLTGLVPSRGSFLNRPSQPPPVEPEITIKSPSCFPAGTQVQTLHGTMPIEFFKPGDQIWTSSQEDGHPVSAEVTKVFVHEYTGEFVTITLSGGGKVTGTGKHPFRVLAGEELASRPQAVDAGPDAGQTSPTGARWVAATDLGPGDLTWTASGPQAIIGITREFRSATVYNLGVAFERTYLVGESGILVHNKTMGDDLGGGGAPPSARKVATDVEATVKTEVVLPNAPSADTRTYTPIDQVPAAEKKAALDNAKAAMGNTEQGQHGTAYTRAGSALERNANEVKPDLLPERLEAYKREAKRLKEYGSSTNHK